jgi:hypothetical protein
MLDQSARTGPIEGVRDMFGKHFLRIKIQDGHFIPSYVIRNDRVGVANAKSQRSDWRALLRLWWKVNR